MGPNGRTQSPFESIGFGVEVIFFGLRIGAAESQDIAGTLGAYFDLPHCLRIADPVFIRQFYLHIADIAAVCRYDISVCHCLYMDCIPCSLQDIPAYFLTVAVGYSFYLSGLIDRMENDHILFMIRIGILPRLLSADTLSANQQFYFLGVTVHLHPDGFSLIACPVPGADGICHSPLGFLKLLSIVCRRAYGDVGCLLHAPDTLSPEGHRPCIS